MSKKKKVRLSQNPRQVLIRKLEARRRSISRKMHRMQEEFHDAYRKEKLRLYANNMQLNALKK